KNAIRVCGDWSEQLSSKGKIYFYNCITEVSQWQKPPEWKLPDMDHDELLRLLRAREQLDARNLKRPRVVGASHANSIKDAEVDHRSASPKRAKYIAEIRSRNVPEERKPSPIIQSESSNCRPNCITPAVTPKVGIPRRANSRTSPRKAYDERSHVDYRFAQSRRDTGSSTNRLAPTDDMDISPDSSPMSGGSSPVHHPYHSQPSASRRIRSGLSHTLPSELSAYSSAKPSIGSHSETVIPPNKSSGPLLQLVDALRASLGLFGDSPNASVAKGTLERFPTTNGAQLGGRTTKSHNSAFHEKDERYRSPSFMTRDGRVRPQCLPSPDAVAPHHRIPEKVSDPSPRLGIPNSNAKSCPDAHRSNITDNPNKARDYFLLAYNSHLVVQGLEVRPQNKKRPNVAGDGSLIKLPINFNFYKLRNPSYGVPVNEKFYRDSDQSNQADRISDLVKLVANTDASQILQSQVFIPLRLLATRITRNAVSIQPVGLGRLAEKQTPSPVDRLLEDKCLTRINKILSSSEALQFLDPTIASRYMDKTVERLEHDAQMEAKKFDQLQSVLYGELSVESKKLRALVRISEAKLAIHKEKQSALQELMDAIETRRHLPSLSFSDDVLGCSTLAGNL
ncbi:unnamed protein product, partial [Echinostoma caproni]|uniref:WW domain-containing protein n=1 Tax=Echinostoma caproni TaxID=27848 RepID=A0A183AH51_9TREM